MKAGMGMFFSKKGPEKLKKIPYDLVSYISIEIDAIQDNSDRHIISSYCLGKLEIVNWYINLLDVGSVKYIVPHSKSELENIREQLLACHKRIMDMKAPSPNDRSFLNIKYPKGYEG
jgi:hypothetical protein